MLAQSSLHRFGHAILACGTVFCVIASSPGVARADETTIRDGRTAIEEQRYEDAIAALTPLTAPGTAVRDRVAALEIVAVADLLLGREAEAKRNVYELYELAPAYELENRALPPSVTTVFERELAQPHARGVALAARPLSADVADYELTASHAAFRIEMVCRKDAGAYTHVEVESRSDGTRRFRLPTLGTYQCAAVAFDTNEMPLGRLGSRAAPVTLHALEKPKPGLTSHWWFWTGVGVLVVGGAAAAYGIAKSQEVTRRPDASISVP